MGIYKLSQKAHSLIIKIDGSSICSGKAFWPNLGVGSSFQVLDILEYACGLKLDSALILNQNPFFEMASKRARYCHCLGLDHGKIRPYILDLL